MASGFIAWAAGLILIAASPLPALAQLATGTLLTAASAVELRNDLLGMSRICRIRITSDGKVEGIGPGGERQVLGLLSGSLVLERHAWLRLRFADGVRSAEWLRPAGADDQQWRMLQILWRHCGALFGRPKGS